MDKNDSSADKMQVVGTSKSFAECQCIIEFYNDYINNISKFNVWMMWTLEILGQGIWKQKETRKKVK